MSDPVDVDHPPVATWRLLTPQPGAADAGAIAVIALHGALDAAMSRLGLHPLRVGEVALRDFGGIDRGIAARPAARPLLLMPHAGPAIVARLCDWLERAGIPPAEHPRQGPPRTAAELRSRVLQTLAVAPSPLAIDLLLDQERRWADLIANGARREGAALPSAHASILRRLIHPPLVVALGPPNIGKSTLVNALAGRHVSLVADAPGTTRDHVGVRLDLAGLVIDYVDAPGTTPSGPVEDPIQREAQSLALRAAHSAALILLCADPTSGFVEHPGLGVPGLRISLRADLGLAARSCDLSLSVRTGQGLAELVDLVRQTLVPAAILADPRPWAFWE